MAHLGGWRALACACVALLVSAGAARGGPLKVELDSQGAGENVTIRFLGHDETVFAGQLRVHLESGPHNSAQFNSFSVDLDRHLNVGQDYDVARRSTGHGLNHGPQIAWLYNTYGLSTLTDGTRAAALQLAIWDLVEDGGDGLTKGDFKYLANDPVAALASQFISEAKHHRGRANWLDAPGGQLNSDNVHGQSLLAPQLAPEPTALLLFGMGAVGMVGYRFGRRR
jgi:PEP-CTERM motif